MRNSQRSAAVTLPSTVPSTITEPANLTADLRVPVNRQTSRGSYCPLQLTIKHQFRAKVSEPLIEVSAEELRRETLLREVQVAARVP